MHFYTLLADITPRKPCFFRNSPNTFSIAGPEWLEMARKAQRDYASDTKVDRDELSIETKFNSMLHGVQGPQL